MTNTGALVSENSVPYFVLYNGGERGGGCTVCCAIDFLLLPKFNCI